MDPIGTNHLSSGLVKCLAGLSVVGYGHPGLEVKSNHRNIQEKKNLFKF